MLLAAAIAAIAVAGAPARAGGPASGRILAVGAESEYADVIAQIGGRFVTVSAVESNPNTDPHAFEASPSVARRIGSARLVVQNGLGYDSYMNTIEAASANGARRVIDVAALLGLPSSTRNPHVWYRPDAMPALARAIARTLGSLLPRHASYFSAHARSFIRSLAPWRAALREFAARYPQTPIAVTEPVGDYMLAAAGARVLTPFVFQSDVMNGVDPSPQAVAFQQSLFSHHTVKALLYNVQVTDTLTASLLADAARHRIPVVAVYETMPAGSDYQSWMLAEVRALRRAVASGASTEKL